MIKIMFVCLGNICRSPMAEFVFKDLIKKQNLEILFIPVQETNLPNIVFLLIIKHLSNSQKKIMINMIILLQWKLQI